MGCSCTNSSIPAEATIGSSNLTSISSISSNTEVLEDMKAEAMSYVEVTNSAVDPESAGNSIYLDMVDLHQSLCVESKEIHQRIQKYFTFTEIINLCDENRNFFSKQLLLKSLDDIASTISIISMNNDEVYQVPNKSMIFVFRGDIQVRYVDNDIHITAGDVDIHESGYKRLLSLAPSCIGHICFNRIQEILHKTAKHYDVSTIPILSNITTEQIMKLLPFINRKQYRNGELILRRGDFSESWFLVLLGEVRSRDTNAKQLDTETTTSYGTGSYFGEEGIIRCRAERYSYVATSDSVELFEISKNCFDDILGDIREILKENIEIEAKKSYETSYLHFHQKHLLSLEEEISSKVDSITIRPTPTNSNDSNNCLMILPTCAFNTLSGITYPFPVTQSNETVVKSSDQKKISKPEMKKERLAKSIKNKENIVTPGNTYRNYSLAKDCE